MHDEKTAALLDAAKKSGWLAALLNLLLPGAGYFYCRQPVLGILALLIVGSLALASMGVLALPFWILIFFDGFFAAWRHNRRLAKRVLG